MTAAANGLTTATSNAFNITVGAAAKLAFTTQPGGGANGTAWTTQPAVTIEDAGGNTVTTATNAITLAIGTNPGGAPGLHHQPAHCHRRRRHLRRLQDHRHGRELHPDRGQRPG